MNLKALTGHQDWTDAFDAVTSGLGAEEPVDLTDVMHALSEAATDQVVAGPNLVRFFKQLVVSSGLPGLGTAIKLGDAVYRYRRERSDAQARDDTLLALINEAHCALMGEEFPEDLCDAALLAKVCATAVTPGKARSDEFAQPFIDAYVARYGQADSQRRSLSLAAQAVLYRALTHYIDQLFAHGTAFTGRHWYFEPSADVPIWWSGGLWQAYGEALLAALPDDECPGLEIMATWEAVDGKPFGDVASVWEFVQERGAVAVGAHPGMGKTTLVFQLTRHLAAALRDMRGECVPMPIVLHDPNWRPGLDRGDGQWALEDYLAKRASAVLGVRDKSLAHRYIAGFFNSPDREVALFVDGVDHLAADDIRVVWHKLLDKVSAAFWSPARGRGEGARPRLVLTARAWVWELELLQEQAKRFFTFLVGRGFSDQVVQAFLGENFSLVEHKFSTSHLWRLLSVPFIASRVRGAAQAGELGQIEADSLAGFYRSLVEFEWRRVSGEHAGAVALEFPQVYSAWSRIALYLTTRLGPQNTLTFAPNGDEFDAFIAYHEAKNSSKPWFTAWPQVPHEQRSVLFLVGIGRFEGADAHGHALFTFTHQTFVEFLAANALVVGDIAVETKPLGEPLTQATPVERLLALLETLQGREPGFGDGEGQPLSAWGQIFVFAGGLLETGQEDFVRGLIRAAEPWLAGRVVFDGGMSVSDKMQHLLFGLLRYGGGDDEPEYWFQFDATLGNGALAVGRISPKELFAQGLPDDAAELIKACLGRLNARYTSAQVADELNHPLRRCDPLVVACWDLLEEIDGDVSTAHTYPFDRLFDRLYVHGHRATYQASFHREQCLLGAGCGWSYPDKRPGFVSDRFGGVTVSEEPNKDLIKCVRDELIVPAIDRYAWRQRRPVVDRVDMVHCLRDQAVSLVRAKRWNERDAALHESMERCEQYWSLARSWPRDEKLAVVNVWTHARYTWVYGEISRQRERYLNEDALGCSEEWHQVKALLDSLVDSIKHMDVLQGKDQYGWHLAMRGIGQVLYFFLLMKRWCVRNGETIAALPDPWPDSDIPELKGRPLDEAFVCCMNSAIATDDERRHPGTVMGQDTWRSLIKDLLTAGYGAFALAIENEDSDPKLIATMQCYHQRALEAIQQLESEGGSGLLDPLMVGATYVNRAIGLAVFDDLSGDELLKELGRGLGVFDAQLKVRPDDRDLTAKCEYVGKLREALKLSDPTVASEDTIMSAAEKFGEADNPLVEAELR